MKKVTFLVLVSVLISFISMAQIKLYLHKTDGSIIEYIAAEIDSITLGLYEVPVDPEIPDVPPVIPSDTTVVENVPFDTLVLDLYENLIGYVDRESYWGVQELTSDEMVVPTRMYGYWYDLNIYHRLHNHEFENTGGIANMWRYLMDNINRCDRLRAKIVKEELKDCTEESLAELYIYRSWFHYLMLDSFDNVQYNGNEISRVAAFDSIMSDLLTYVPKASKEKKYGRVNKYVGWMILSKMYLNAEAWGVVGAAKYASSAQVCYETSAVFADSIISKGGYSLEPNYFTNFKVENQNSRENIWSIVCEEQEDMGLQFHLLTLQDVSQDLYGLKERPWNGYCTTHKVVGIYGEGDKRIATWERGQQFDKEGNATSTTISVDYGTYIAMPEYVRKPENWPQDLEAFQLMAENSYGGVAFEFPGYYTDTITTLTNNDSYKIYNNLEGPRFVKFEIQDGVKRYMSNDFPIYRLADVYLMKAEALIRANGGGATLEAVDAVNVVRSRAGASTYTTATLTLDELSNERCRELSWEGHRRQDLIRFNRFTGVNSIPNDNDLANLWILKDNTSDDSKKIFTIDEGAKVYIEWYKTKERMTVGEEYTFEVSVSGLDGVSWSSSDESIATVDDKGTVVALAVGDVKIYATYNGRTTSTTIEVFVPKEPLPMEDVPEVATPTEEETTFLFQIENAECDDFELYLMGIDGYWGDLPEMKFERVEGTLDWFQLTIPAVDEIQYNFKIRANGDWSYEPKRGYEYYGDTHEYVEENLEGPNNLSIIKPAGGKVLAFKVVEFISICDEKIPAGYAKFVFTMEGDCPAESVIFTGNFEENSWSESTREMTKQDDGTYVWEGEYPEDFRFKTIAIVDGVQFWLEGSDIYVSEETEDEIYFSGCFQGYCPGDDEEIEDLYDYTASGVSNGYEYVDLGLPSGTLWATMNVGATTPFERGSFFAWGETEPKDYYSDVSYKWCDGEYYTKYNLDNKTILELADDAANVNLGGDWRMPTREDVEELIAECIWTYGVQKGIKGYSVTGSNGKSIFLPIAGFAGESVIANEDCCGYYWCSEKQGDYYDGACNLTLDFHSVDMREHYTRSIGQSVRSVLHTAINYSLTFDSNYGDGIMQPITVNYAEVITIPENRFTRLGYEFICWNTKVDGTGINYEEGDKFSIGSNITLYAQWYKKETDVMHEYVDLGLSVKWSTCNVGASKPEEMGYIFSWGETKPKAKYSEETYKWFNETSNGMTKYCNNLDYDTVDNKTTLELQDDAANVNWGGDWRMPTNTEQVELKTECTWKWVTQNGVKGYKVTSNINGNSIFLPAECTRPSKDVYDGAYEGSYWSCSLSANSHRYADRLYISFNGGGSSVKDRCTYSSVRPVLAVGSTYNVVFDNNGGEGIMSPITVKHAEVFSIPENKFIRTGYEFICWNTKADGTGISYDIGEKFSIGSGIILYAQWYKKEINVNHEYVDLGLPSGTLWATCNVGASSPDEYGYFFSWGETKPKVKYRCGYYNEYGKIVLELSDDAAYVNWGANWRMPTKEELDELRAECTWTWCSSKSVNGYIVTGLNGNSIFLPAAGNRQESNSFNTGLLGEYWSSSIYDDIYMKGSAYFLSFTSVYKGCENGAYDSGRSIRPVLNVE